MMSEEVWSRSPQNYHSEMAETVRYDIVTSHFMYGSVDFWLLFLCAEFLSFFSLTNTHWSTLSLSLFLGSRAPLNAAGGAS